MRSVCKEGSQLKAECLYAFSYNHFHAARLTVMAHIAYIYMLRPCVEIKDYSVAYFDHITEFKVLYHCAS